MPFDKNKAVKYAQDNALPVFGKGLCATHVREALEAGGLNTAGHPAAAKDWGHPLVKMGFTKIGSGTYSPDVGDVVVFQSIKGHQYGHIEIYDGKNWVSDFVQPDFYPARAYQAAQASYAIYRY